jgi:hypothetical protein
MYAMTVPSTEFRPKTVTHRAMGNNHPKVMKAVATVTGRCLP